MTLFKMICEAEDAVIQVERARAVLTEATHYFESTDKEDINLIPYYASHIFLLLDATNMLLFDTIKELSNAAKEASQSTKGEVV